MRNPVEDGGMRISSRCWSSVDVCLLLMLQPVGGEAEEEEEEEEREEQVSCSVAHERLMKRKG
jgi:hypothetical protein